ncbi:MAG: hotdog domain-containing protein [Endozoicomonas sp. (ex Botrylloides leachii)]|nr:hotdog domain-containing protein [Endozoicomonas sp. (ex Botrylloides leachii)]
MNIHPVAYEPASDFIPGPQGELVLKVMADHSSLNSKGDVFGGWVALNLDQAGEIEARKVANVQRVAVVSIGAMSFLHPVKMGDVIAFYSKPKEIGRTSITVEVEAWVEGESSSVKLTEASLVFVAMDDQGRTRRITQ